MLPGDQEMPALQPLSPEESAVFAALVSSEPLADAARGLGLGLDRFLLLALSPRVADYLLVHDLCTQRRLAQSARSALEAVCKGSQNLVQVRLAAAALLRSLEPPKAPRAPRPPRPPAGPDRPRTYTSPTTTAAPYSAPALTSQPAATRPTAEASTSAGPEWRPPVLPPGTAIAKAQVEHPLHPNQRLALDRACSGRPLHQAAPVEAGCQPRPANCTEHPGRLGLPLSASALRLRVASATSAYFLSGRGRARPPPAIIAPHATRLGRG